MPRVPQPLESRYVDQNTSTNLDHSIEDLNSRRKQLRASSNYVSFIVPVRDINYRCVELIGVRDGF